MRHGVDAVHPVFVRTGIIQPEDSEGVLSGVWGAIDQRISWPVHESAVGGDGEGDTSMKAFLGDPAIKQQYLARLRAHAQADELIHGTYWEHGKGCAVGCTVHSSNHTAYETELGIPEVLARLEDGLFESLPNGDAKEFPIQFLDAIPVGADLSRVWPSFAVWLLLDKEDGVIRFSTGFPQVQETIQGIGNLFKKVLNGQPVTEAARAAGAARAAAGAAGAARFEHYACGLLDLIVGKDPT